VSTGNSWQYSGTNSAIGSYTRTDTIANSSADRFTVQSTEADVSSTANFSCTSDGFMAADPLQQYAGALLSSPNAPVSVKLTSNSGITLPAHISPGDTWQQTAGFEASSSDLNLNIHQEDILYLCRFYQIQELHSFDGHYSPFSIKAPFWIGSNHLRVQFF
jgi:hypothetical protein